MVTRKQYLFLFCCLLFSFLVPVTLNMNIAFYGVLGNFALLLGCKLLHRWLFVIMVCILTLTCSLFLPQMIWYGEFPEVMVASFFQTDLAEAKEFLQSLPWYAYTLSVLMLVFGGWLCHFSLKIPMRVRYKYGIVLGLFVVTAFITLYKPYLLFKEGGGFQMIHSRTSAISFYFRVYGSVKGYFNFMEDVKKSMSENDSWQIEKTLPKYKNYVLIIGESARSDYMSAYGYPHQNTPFMQSVKGCLLEGYISAGAITISSLSRTIMQVKDNDTIEYKNNIVSLAKKAGFKVYWLSNQGRYGDHDTQISLIAMKSDVAKFTKKGDYASNNAYDSALLPFFKEALADETTQPKLIVLHLLGSHQNFKQRLEKSLHWSVVNEDISAYIQTLEQTDDFLKQIRQILENQFNSFSMLYFSDHGLETKDRDYKSATTLAHGYTKGAYRVPFFISSSDDVEHRRMKVQKSAFYFMNGFASWLGIEEKSLKSYSFTDAQKDSLRVFDGTNLLNFNDLQEDIPVK